MNCENHWPQTAQRFNFRRRTKIKILPISLSTEKKPACGFTPISCHFFLQKTFLKS
jgi:hypothetical protein